MTASGRWTSQAQSCFFPCTGGLRGSRKEYCKRASRSLEVELLHHTSCLFGWYSESQIRSAGLFSKNEPSNWKRGPHSAKSKPKGLLASQATLAHLTWECLWENREGWCHHYLSLCVHQSNKQTSFPGLNVCYKGGTTQLKHLQITVAGLQATL